MLSRLPAREFEASNSESEQPIHTEVPETGTSDRIDTSDRLKQARLDLESEEESFQLATIFGSPTLQLISPEQLAESTNNDPPLAIVKQFVLQSWPKKKPTDPQLRSYFSVRDELSHSRGVIFRGTRAVIPEQLRNQVLQLAHEGHPGIVKTKQICRESVW